MNLVFIWTGCTVFYQFACRR